MTATPSAGMGMRRAALIDASGLYRYRLWRTWDESGERVVFVMLNPSAADAFRDDPTIRRCVGFARRWGFGALEVVNLFAYRASSPRALREAEDPIGVMNDRHLLKAAREGHRIVAAWGVWGHFRGRGKRVAEMLSRVARLYCVGLTRGGCPRHPLYAPAGAPLIRWKA